MIKWQVGTTYLPFENVVQGLTLHVCASSRRRSLQANRDMQLLRALCAEITNCIFIKAEEAMSLHIDLNNPKVSESKLSVRTVSNKLQGSKNGVERFKKETRLQYPTNLFALQYGYANKNPTLSELPQWGTRDNSDASLLIRTTLHEKFQLISQTTNYYFLHSEPGKSENLTPYLCYTYCTARTFSWSYTV